MKSIVPGLLAAILVLGPTVTHAGLTVLADTRFVYDDVLDVTWLRDANAGAGSGFDDGQGLMNWASAMAWAGSLSYTLKGPGGSRTYEDWGLPMMTLINDPPCYSYDGGCDGGSNIARPDSPLAYMYSMNLGNVSRCSTDGHCPQPGWTATPNATFIDRVTNQPESFQDLQSSAYWYGTEQWFSPHYWTAWGFNFTHGSQGQDLQDHLAIAWPIHPGLVVAPVSEPHPWAMLMLGLGWLGWQARTRRELGA